MCVSVLTVPHTKGFCSLTTAALADDGLPTLENTILTPFTSRPPVQLTGALTGFTKIFVLKIVPENILWIYKYHLKRTSKWAPQSMCSLKQVTNSRSITSVRISSLKILGFKHHQTATEKIWEDRIIRLMPWCKGIFKYFNTASNQNLD